MITRIWHGRIRKEDAYTYRKYVTETGIKAYFLCSGNQGAQILQRDEEEITHIYIMSWWDNIESIKAFAGEEYEKAKYFEKDKNYLLELEPMVFHYETFNFVKWKK